MNVTDSVEALCTLPEYRLSPQLTNLREPLFWSSRIPSFLFLDIYYICIYPQITYIVVSCLSPPINDTIYILQGYWTLIISCGPKAYRVPVLQCQDHTSGCPNSFHSPSCFPQLPWLTQAYSPLSIQQRTHYCLQHRWNFISSPSKASPLISNIIQVKQLKNY